MAQGNSQDLFHGNSPGRGIQNHSGGAYDQSTEQDIMDGDSLQGGITLLTGLADVLNPHVAGNYIIDSIAPDLITFFSAPTPGSPIAGAPTTDVDDGLSVNIWSDSNVAHVVSAPNLFANGTALKSTATFAAFRGAGMTLRAIDGVWHVVTSSGVTFT